MHYSSTVLLFKKIKYEAHLQYLLYCTISSKRNRTGLNIFALFLLKNENTPVDNIQQEEDDRKEYPAVGVQPEIKFF